MMYAFEIFERRVYNKIYLSLVNGVEFGYWSFQFGNVNWYNMEM